MKERLIHSFGYKLTKWSLFAGGLLMIGHEAAHEADKMPRHSDTVATSSQVEGIIGGVALLGGDIMMMAAFGVAKKESAGRAASEAVTSIAPPAALPSRLPQAAAEAA